MAWGFRKRIRVSSTVHLNISRTGISTTIGKKFFSINLGKKGAFLNQNVPGTGLYNREKISSHDFSLSSVISKIFTILRGHK